MPKKVKAVVGLAAPGRAPRSKLKISGNATSTVVEGNTPIIDLTGTGGGASRFVVLVDPADADGPVREVAKNFNTYHVRRFELHYSPNVGTTTSGKVWRGYFDNPEIIYKATSGMYTSTQLLDLIKYGAQSEVSPVWQPFVMRAPLRRRRKELSIDTSALASAEVADRTVHGMIIVAIEGNATADQMGVLTTCAAYECHGLQSYSVSGV